MTNPNYPTPMQWAGVRSRARDGSVTDRYLLELFERIQALEANSKSSSNSGQIRTLRATDEELHKMFKKVVGDSRFTPITNGFRAIYDLGRQHEAQSPSPKPVPLAGPAGMGLVDCLFPQPTEPAGGPLLEQIAEQVYAAMCLAAVNEPRRHSPADIPDWTPGGNSLMQDHARVAARRILQDASAWVRRGDGLPPDGCWSQVADVLDAEAAR